MSEHHTETTAEPGVFAELNKLEARFHEAEDQLLKRQVELYKPLYEERDPLLSQIPKFWLTVIEESQDIQELFNVEDLKLLDCLQSIKVTRDNADPRNFTVAMTFNENEFLEASDLTMSKKFTRSEDDEGYTSTPSSIKWKKNITAGSKGARPSFFKFFDWTGDEDDVFSAGEEVALILADELYPDALKIWTDAQDLGSQGDSEAGSINIDSDDDEDDNEEVPEEDEGPQKKKSKTTS